MNMIFSSSKKLTKASKKSFCELLNLLSYVKFPCQNCEKLWSAGVKVWATAGDWEWKAQFVSWQRPDPSPWPWTRPQQASTQILYTCLHKYENTIHNYDTQIHMYTNTILVCKTRIITHMPSKICTMWYIHTNTHMHTRQQFTDIIFAYFPIDILDSG